MCMEQGNHNIMTDSDYNFLFPSPFPCVCCASCVTCHACGGDGASCWSCSCACAHSCVYASFSSRRKRSVSCDAYACSLGLLPCFFVLF